MTQPILTRRTLLGFALSTTFLTGITASIAQDDTNMQLAYLPRRLTQLERGPFPNAEPGELCYYVPWGNLVLFHGRYESTSDLVRLGRLDGDVGPLLVRGEFALRVERL